MTIEDPQTAQTGFDASAPRALRNLVLVLLLLLLGTAGGLALFGSMIVGETTELTDEAWAAATERQATADEAYGTLDAEPIVIASLSSEDIDAFRERSEGQVREFYEAQEQGLYQRIVEAGLYGKGTVDSPSEWVGVGGPVTEVVQLVPTSLGGSADGTFSGIPTTPLQTAMVDPLGGPTAIGPIGQLPQVVFPGLSGPGGLIPPPTLNFDDPIGEIPVPGALLLFPAGLALIAKARKRRAG
ncbi:MAG: hypothetical protein AAF608_14320 [Pseudomonadota bacterium]